MKLTLALLLLIETTTSFAATFNGTSGKIIHAFTEKDLQEAIELIEEFAPSKLSTDDVGVTFDSLIYEVPLSPADELRREADRIEARDRFIQRARNFLNKHKKK